MPVVDADLPPAAQFSSGAFETIVGGPGRSSSVATRRRRLRILKSEMPLALIPPLGVPLPVARSIRVR